MLNETPITLIDSHVHLDFGKFDKDRDAIIARAHQADVTTMITIGCRLESCHRALQIAETYPSVYAAIGVHPHQAGETCPEEIAEIRKLLSHPKVVGVGESGLDYHYMHSPKDVQLDVFRTFINIAQEEDLPLIVHTRDAEEDTIRLLREEYKGVPYRGVLHCFTGTKHLAETCIDMGFYVSISGIATFVSSLQEIIATLPLDRLLVETDAPYLAPSPHRGKRNEPAYVRHTAQTLARLFGISLAELSQKTTENTRTLFRLPV